MQVRPFPAVLAVLTGFFSCTVLGKISTMNLLQQTGHYVDSTFCRTIPGLTKAQTKLCNQQPDATEVALQGLRLAVRECQHQFQNQRWNCSSLATRAKNPYASAIFQRGYRETAYAHAIASAGVAVAVAKACSQGLLVNCGCDNHKYKVKGSRSFTSTTWKWGGCSHNLRYGMRFSKKFLDSSEDADDIQSVINLHNNQVGRKAVSKNMEIKCKCHGMSGSCELKTCWRATPDFRVVGKALKERFRSAILVNQPNLGNRRPSQADESAVGPAKRKNRLRLKHFLPHKKKVNRDLAFELLFYQKSPNFCEKDQSLEVLGTAGRSCNTTTSGPDSCSTLCCGRGYNLIRQKRIDRCNCKFHWCCEVKCETCTVEEWISVCK